MNPSLSPALTRHGRKPWPRAAHGSQAALPRLFRRPSLLIVGCGDVGMRLLDQLSAKGRRGPRLVAVSRRESQQAAIRERGARALAADLDDHRSLARLTAFARWMVHLAPPPNSGCDDRRTRHLLAALARATQREARRWTYVSTTGVYGDHAGALISETTPVKPASDRAVRRVSAERLLRKALRSSGDRLAILRAPGIYAADRLPVERLRQGLPALRPEDDTYTNHIHADDLATACWLALFRAKPGRVFNTVDQSSLRMGDYFDQVADALRLPRPPRVTREQLERDPRISPMMRSFMSESRRLSGARLRRELRMELAYPTVADTLRLINFNPALV